MKDCNASRARAPRPGGRWPLSAWRNLSVTREIKASTAHTSIRLKARVRWLSSCHAGTGRMCVKLVRRRPWRSLLCSHHMDRQREVATADRN